MYHIFFSHNFFYLTVYLSPEPLVVCASGSQVTHSHSTTPSSTKPSPDKSHLPLAGSPQLWWRKTAAAEGVGADSALADTLAAEGVGADSALADTLAAAGGIPHNIRAAGLGQVPYWEEPERSRDSAWGEGCYGKQEEDQTWFAGGKRSGSCMISERGCS